MNKDKLQLLSPLFLKHQADYEKNPRSRVFAPLAETYRKLGMTDKAMQILSQGIRFHPSYLMGYLGLAFCYYDLKQYNLAYSTLRPLIESSRDNIRLQKLFSDICLELDKKEEALETLKYLLFVNPRDKNIAELVLRIEAEVDESYKSVHRPIIIPEKELRTENEDSNTIPSFDLDKLTSTSRRGENDFDDWMSVDFNNERKEVSNKQINHDDWSMKKVDEHQDHHVHLDLENDSDPSVEQALLETLKPPVLAVIPEKINEIPLVTHTLVDLYCGQGHIEKALEVLEKILQLNPNDEKTIQKIQEIQALAHPFEEITNKPEEHFEQTAILTENIGEEDGRRRLMSLIDEKIKPIVIEENSSKSEVVFLIEEKLSLFLKKIQKRALDYQGSV